jgi:hypothetical protein
MKGHCEDLITVVKLICSGVDAAPLAGGGDRRRKKRPIEKKSN